MVIVRGAGLRAALAGCVLLIAPLRKAWGHPIHTTMAELALRPGGRTIRAMIRVFDDDFGRAVLGLPATAPAPADAAVGDVAAAAYVRAHFAIAGSGQPLPLSWCGVTRSANVVWVCVEAAWAGDARALRVANRMLFDLYRDQINIVQGTLDGKSASLLFTRGDGAKPLL